MLSYDSEGEEYFYVFVYGPHPYELMKDRDHKLFRFKLSESIQAFEEDDTYTCGHFCREKASKEWHYFVLPHQAIFLEVKDLWLINILDDISSRNVPRRERKEILEMIFTFKGIRSISDLSMREYLWESSLQYYCQAVKCPVHWTRKKSNRTPGHLWSSFPIENFSPPSSKMSLFEDGGMVYCYIGKICVGTLPTGSSRIVLEYLQETS